MFIAELVLMPTVAQMVFFKKISLEQEIIYTSSIPYQKQSYFNRIIYKSGKGKRLFTIPVIRETTKNNLNEVKICYNQAWVKEHVNALRTAYSKAPYFDYLASEYFSIINKRYLFLRELNGDMMIWINDLLEINNYSIQDESDSAEKINENPNLLKPYYQINNDFIPDVSVLDLIMNMGKEAILYLNNPHII